MATSPSLTINSISNAVITDTNESVSMGKISWSVASQADSTLSATYYNYQNYANWDNRYSWTSDSGTTSFNGLSSTVTIHARVSFTTKTIVATKVTPSKGQYQSLSAAESAYPNAGNNTYYYSYEYVQGWYYVYQYNLTVEPSTYSRDVIETVDVSGNITIQGTEPPTSQPSYVISDITHSSVTLTVSNLSIGDQVKCTVYLASAEIGSDSAYATGGDVSLSVIGLDSDTEYTITVIIVNQSKSLGTKQFTTSSVSIEGDFEWDTDIRAGAIMNTYMYTGTHYPAPVTAAEWNRLVDLVNKKCGTSIGKVASGVRMYASSGGNVRRVADALGVAVDSGDIITAQFFLDLRDAVNAKN